MTTVYEAVAEPSRRRILDLLRGRECSVSDLVEALQASQPSVSKHLRVLRDAGLVSSRVAAQHRMYRLETASLRALDEWLAPYRRLWAGSLDALEAHLDNDTFDEEA